MRFACLLVAGYLAALGLQVQAAEGYSKAYTQCMNFSYGNTAKAKKCVKKELKAQKKRLKKNYKTYLKLNSPYQNNIRAQHTLWERKMSQQCNLGMTGQYAQIQQGQCRLALVVDQASLYQSRSYSRGL
ncbi:DUF1311 domain-containing protein [Acinetobacter indicus]|nr:DUF1311 domain-containing protein [Acinetobacter indicus]